MRTTTAGALKVGSRYRSVPGERWRTVTEIIHHPGRRLDLELVVSIDRGKHADPVTSIGSSFTSSSSIVELPPRGRPLEVTSARKPLPRMSPRHADLGALRRLELRTGVFYDALRRLVAGADLERDVEAGKLTRDQLTYIVSLSGRPDAAQA